MDMNIDGVGERIDRYLLSYLQEKGYGYVTRSFLKSNWEKGFVLLNGKSVKPSYKIKEKDNVEILEEKILNTYEIVDPDNIISEKGSLNIVFEDSNILVLNKESGISIHPGVGNPSGTIANFVRGYLEEKGEYDNKLSRAGVVHRLDKAVSGLVVFAKNKETQLYLQKQFQERKINKIYYAKLQGKELPQILEDILKIGNVNIQNEIEKLKSNDFVCDESWYEVSGYISRSSKNRMKMQFSPFSSPSGKNSVTYLKPLSSNELLIKIETGRMHQIRATLAYLGLCIKGDTLYESSSGGEIPQRIELKSVLLNFTNINGKELLFDLLTNEKK
ncbi:RluA family pseudouridine synthase [Candidatus Microgenomates bacterium]|nr:RluA family pseudouridine synthase [Candidatus Microgenomates bacterium]